MKLVGALAVGALISVVAHAATPPLAKCQGAKVKAAGAKVYAKAKCYQKAFLKGLPVDTTCLLKAEQKFGAAVNKADEGGPCPGVASDLEASVDSCVATLVDGVQTTTTTTTTTSSTTTSTLVAGSLCAPCTANTDCLNFGSSPGFSPCHSFVQGQRCTRQCVIDADCGSPSGACDTTQGVCKCSS